MTTTAQDILIHTRLSILVDPPHEQALRDALRGPAQWWGMPSSLPDIPIPTEHLSAHARMDIIHHHRYNWSRTPRAELMDLVSAYRAAHPGYPQEWLVSEEALRAWCINHQRPHHEHQVDCSFPRLAALVPRFFHPLLPAFNPTDAVLATHTIPPHTWTRWCTDTLGTADVPKHINAKGRPYTPPTLRKALIAITWTTHGQPISTLDALLRPVLAAHGAQALAVWGDTSHLLGFARIDPKRDPLTDVLHVDVHARAARQHGIKALLARTEQPDLQGIHLLP